ncbi:HAD family hydrolase [Caldimonas sp. KR1-144]|uniref:HAD family hydrolase n=1 Tax=Caldimonas sp. KR1-144 TaxID=3400911 RepID=UPI003C0D01CA
MSAAPALQALLFDVDGTLAETERDGHRIAFNAAFEAAGLGWHWDVETYGRLLAITGGKERMLAWWQEREPVSTPKEVARRAERVKALHADKTLRYTALVAAGRVRLRPGIERLIDEARADGLRLAIATTTTPDNVSALLRHTLGEDASRWFDVIGAGDVVAAKKPAPDIYRWVLERLQLAPEATLALEDSANGLAAARAAGVPCVVSPSVYARGESFDGALAVIERWGALGTLRQWHAEAASPAFACK